MNTSKIKIINIREGEYIRIRIDWNKMLCTYYKGDREVKSLFNPNAFIQWLRGAGIPKKYIKQVESEVL